MAADNTAVVNRWCQYVRKLPGFHYCHSYPIVVY